MSSRRTDGEGGRIRDGAPAAGLSPEAGGSFDAWSLPGWASVDRTEAVPRAHAGVEVRYPAADPVWIARLTAGLDAARGPGRSPSSTALLERAALLGGVGARFLDKNDPLRRSALRLLPATSDLSAPMSKEVLDGMAADWTATRLRRLVEEELGAIVQGDGSAAGGRRSLPVAPRLCVQLVAGSVPGVGVTALIRSLLIGAPTLLKPGLGDVVLPTLFADALREASPRVADELAVVYWPGGSEEVERAAFAAAEVGVVYGGDATVAGIRARAPSTVRLVEYRHREGVGVVGSGVLDSPDTAAETAEDVAWAVSLFDQRGCVSPGVVFVEAPRAEPAGVDVPPGPAVTPAAFAGLLATSLAVLEERLPSGVLDSAERSALQQLRGTAELLGAGTGEATLDHGGARPWTVVYDPDGRLDDACVGRSVIVRPFRTPAEVIAALQPRASHLQTVGVAGLGTRLEALASELGRLGASRVTPFRAVPFPPPWWHHDGRGPLLDLVRWVDLEGG